MKFFPLVLVLASIFGSLAIPVQKKSSCSSKCTGVQNNFRYQSGKAYVYELESETKVQLLGSGETENVVVQRATVTINVQQSCEFAMQLSNVQLEGASVSPNWKSILESNPVRFSFDDGLIDNICSSDNDPIWSLNIKRGILSTFQHALQGSSPQTETQETDISGLCPTNYEIKDEEGGRNVYRTKKLLNCRGYHGNYTAIRGIPYDANSRMQQTPLVDSEQQCRHTIRRQILQDAACTETHVFKPFDQKDKAGIISTTIQKLTFKQETNSDDTVFIQVSDQKSLQFDHSEFEFEQSQEASGLAKTDVQRFCQISADTVRSETPSLFTSLIHNLRKMKETELRQFWQTTKTNKQCANEKKFVLDAIPMCGTEDCVKLMVTFLQSNELSIAEKHMWYISFAFVPRVTGQMVKEVIPLVDNQNVKGLLGITSLVHGYCRQNPLCSENPEVARFMGKLEQKLGQDCQASGSTEIEKMVLVLKAISNVGHYGSLIPTIQRCFEQQSNSIEVRISAINALRRMPCEQDSLNSLWNVYKQMTYDTELRITAFMQLMRCPHQPQFSVKLQESIEVEKVNQVGSFVYSFIKSKRDSDDPTQTRLQSVLQQIRLERRFNRDPRKYSRFTEVGQFSHNMNLGGQMEQGMIFTPQNMMPRNVFANLTVHLFGSSVNLIELGARQEGFDKLLDSMFGPEGYFTNPNGYEFKHERSGVKSNRLQSLEDLYKKRTHYRPSNKLALSMYVKVFGDELGYLGFEGENVMDDIKEMMNVEKILQSLAQNKEVKLTKNILFADSVKTIPTISGLPMRIAIKGAASIDLDISGKMDLTKILKRQPGQPIDLDIMTRVRPSAAIEISSIVAIQVDKVKSGVKMVSRLHTSTAVDTNIQFTGGKLLKTKISLPQDKMEIIDIQSELYNVVNDIPTSQGVQNSKTYKACTPNGFNRVLGLKLCAHAKTPKPTKQSPIALLNGPNRVMLTAEKVDKKLNSYEMEVEWSETGYPKRFLLDTPGSDVDREIRVQINHQRQQNKLKVDLRSPFKRLGFEGQWTNPQPNKGQGTLALTVDGKDKYELDLITQSSDNGVVYEAIGRVPDRQPIKVRAEANCHQRTSIGYSIPMCKNFDLDTKLTGLYDKPIEFKAKYSTQPLDAEIEWKCPASHAGIKLTSNGQWKNDKEFERQNMFEIVFKRTKIGKTHKLRLENKLNTKRPGGGSYELLEVTKLETTIAPEYNFVGGLDVKVSPKKMYYKYDINYGMKEQNKLMLLVDGEKKSQHRREMDFAVQWDAYKINEKGRVIIEKQYPTKVLLSLESRNGKTNQKRLFSEVRFVQDKGAKIDFEAEAKVQYPGREMRVFYEMNEAKKNQYKTKLIGQWQVGKQVEVDSDIHWKGGKQEYEYMVNAIAKMTGKPEPIYFHKRVKVSRTGVKYLAYMKRGDDSLYDFKLDITERANNDYKMISHFKSGYMHNVDYEADGHLKTANHQYELVADVKRNQKDFAKIELMTPSRLSQITNKKLKARVMWQLDSTKPKELMAEYKGHKGTPRRHELTLKSQLNGDNYKYNMKLQVGDVYMLNTTFVHNNRPLIEVGLGLSPRHPMEADFGFQTHHPWKKQHYTGMLLAQYDQNKPRQGKFEMELKCHTSNKRVMIMLDVEKPGKDHRKWTVKAEAGDLGINLNGNMKTQCKGTYSSCDILLDYSGKLFWAPQKQIEHDGHYEWKSAGKKQSFSLNYSEQLKTPFTSAKQMKFEIDLKEVTKDHLMTNFKLEHNNKEKLTLEVALTGKSVLKTLNNVDSLDIKMTTDRPTLKKAHVKLDLDYSKGTNIAGKLTWNTENELGAIYKHDYQSGQPATSSLISANVKIPKENVDSRIRVEADYDQPNQKLNGEVQLKLNTDQYKVGVNLDGVKGSGIVKIQTPFDQWKTGKLQITKIAEGEYKIEGEKNGKKMGSMKGQIRTTTRSFLLKLDVEQVDEPFEIVIERTRGEQSRTRLQLVRSPKTPEKQVYGMDLTLKSVRGKMGDCKLRLDVDHRYVELTYLKGRELFEIMPILYRVPINWKVELQLNGKSQKQPTVVTVGPANERKANGGTYKSIQMKLTDPNLTKPIIVKFETAMEVSVSRFSLTLDYSGEASKTFTAMATLKNVRTDTYGDRNGRIELSIEHPETKLHNKLWMEWLNIRHNEYPYHVLTGVEYINKINEVRQWEAKVEIPNERKINLRLNGPESVYRFEAKIKRSYGYQYLAKFTIDDKPVFVIATILDTKNKKIEMEIRQSENSDVLFHASTRLVNKDTAQISIWHTEKGRRLDDGDIRVELNRADLLKTKFFLRPGLHRELQYAAERSLDRMSSGARWNYQTSGFQTPQFMSDLHRHTQPMLENWSEQQNIMNQELGPGMETVKEQLSDLIEIVREIFWAAVDITEQNLDEVIKSIPGDSFQRSYRKMKESLKNVGENFDEMLAPFSYNWEQFVNGLKEISRTSEEYKNAVSRFLRDNFNLDRIQNSVSDSLDSLCNSDIAIKISDFLKSLNMDPKTMKKRAAEVVDAILEKISYYARSLQSYAGQLEESLSDNPFYSTVIKPMFENFEEKVKDYVENMRINLWQTYSPQKYIPRVTVNNPEEGHYEMEFPLPVKSNSLKHLAKRFHPKSLQRMKERIEDKVEDWTDQVVDAGQEAGYGIMDNLYQYKPRSFDVVNWVPPFAQHAYLIGNQHIVTFDGKVFDFNANCEYLLASDFHQNKFIITASFVKKDNTVVLDKITAKLVGAEIELNADGTVEIKDEEKDKKSAQGKTELPWQKLDEMEGTMLVQVERKDHSVVVKTFDEIKVKCDWYYHVCQISLPGRYHGQSAGLLGSNDNEPHNDLFLPDGTENEEVNTFAQKWHLSGDNCEAKRSSALNTKITKDHAMHSECEQHFNDNNSPFRSCFRAVNPRPFMEMCLTDMHRQVSRHSLDRHREGLCNISAAYLMACRQKIGQTTELLPGHCARCDNPTQPGTKFTEDDSSVELNQPIRSVDVVYVVEEAPYMKFSQDKLSALNRQIKDKLNTQDVRYGVIGFGGEGVHDKPHYHTGNNKINFGLNGLTSAFQSLDFERISEPEQRYDPMEALLFAADYPFRAGVMKSVVLITCNKCHGQKINYYDLQQVYLMRDIKLNMLTVQQIQMSSPQSPKISGFDARQMYTVKGEEKRELRSSLTEPHDSCTVLAQETNGTVWSLSKTQKGDVTVIGEKIGEKLNEQITQNQCQVCECNVDHCSPKTICFPCEVPRPVSLTQNGFFNQPYIKLHRKLKDFGLA